MITLQRLRSLAWMGLIAAGAAAVGRAEDYAIISIAGTTSVSGTADGIPGKFTNPYGLAIDSAKNIYVADTGNNTIRKITPAGSVSTLAGTPGIAGSKDGTGTAAQFNYPVGVAVDAGGNVYVADVKNSTIRKITPDGVVTTFAGTAGQFGFADGAGASARFFLPSGVATDSAGNIYVADTGNHTIRKISSGGAVTTLAGTAQQSGFVDGTGAAARFQGPWAIAVDAGGNLYVADTGNNAIRKVSASGAVTTVAGAGGQAGSVDGPVSSARFNQPRGVALDNAGNLFVTDYGNQTIRLVTTAGTVTTLAGSPGIAGANDAVGADARLYDPIGLAADNTTIYFSDSSNNLVRKGVPASTAQLPTIVAQPLAQTLNAGQSVTFSVIASGNGLTYQWLRNTAVIPGANSASYTIGSVQAGDAAVYKVHIGSATGSRDSTDAALTVVPQGQGPITARPSSQTVSVGQSVSFGVAANGGGVTYQWSKNNTPITGATNATYTITSAQTSDAADYSVKVTSGGTSETATATLVVITQTITSVTITTQPASQSVATGQSVTLSVAASGTGLSYQWFKGGSAITGANSATYTIGSAQAGDAGNYFVRVSGAGGASVDSGTATVTVNAANSGPTSRLSNLSVRTAMNTGQTLIVGVTVSGGSRDILVRAAGPALAAFGLTTAMADPRLDMYNGQTLTLSNDNWDSSLASAFASVGAFAFPTGSKDAALVQTLSGGYTIQCRGTGPGVVLVEAYDLGSGMTPRMTNVSARNQVGTGDNILIAGFTITGTGSKQLLIRAVGPALAGLGVQNVLADPKLEVYDSSNLKVTENDNWSSTLATTFSSVGAFPLDAGSKDSALVVNLPAGGYTVQVKGADGGTGEALVEIYELP